MSCSAQIRDEPWVAERRCFLLIIGAPDWVASVIVAVIYPTGKGGDHALVWVDACTA